MPTVAEAQAALREAVRAKDAEAVRFIKEDLKAAYESESKGLYNPISGMSAGQRVAANIGAGATNLWQGTKQALLPQALEDQFGASEADVADKRAMDDRLANSVEGGRAWQVVGEAAPFAAVPAGLVARGLTAIPKIGGALQAAGVGSRVMPTLLAEGAAIGSAAGASMPVGEGESRVFNAAVGGIGGAVAPAALGGAGALYRKIPLPGARALQERAVARQVGSEVPGVAARIKQLDKGIKAPGLTETPTTAVMLKDPRLASTELAYRAMPEFAPGWQQLDDAASEARWNALDGTLGSSESVTAAKKATDDFIQKAKPAFFKSVNKAELNKQSIGFESAVQARLNAAVRDADPNAQAVYGYITSAREKGARYSPQSLWNIRKTLSSWLEGTPPPGYEGTRGAKMDGPIMEVRAAIDSMLNSASGNKWERFLGDMGEYAQKETAQKSGQNIRNAFVDETLGIPRKTTRRGVPEVTPAAMRQAYSKFGKNNFGPTLDWPQEDAVTQVMNSLQAEDILATAKKSATGGGGSQTVPLGAALLKNRGGEAGGTVMQVLKEIQQMGEGRQREIINRMLQDPAYARDLLRLAADQAAPLTTAQRNAILAVKAGAVGAYSVNN